MGYPNPVREPPQGAMESTSFVGAFDEVMVLNRALSGEEVMSLYKTNRIDGSK